LLDKRFQRCAALALIALTATHLSGCAMFRRAPEAKAAPVAAAETASTPAPQSTGPGKLPEWAPKPKPNVVEDRFRAEVTLLGASFDTTIRVDPSITRQGTELSAEDDLGLDSSQILPQAELTLLPGKNHLVRLSGFSTRRSASKRLERQIVFDDQIYRVNERVDSELNITMIGLTYGYRFLVRNRGELTATFGIEISEVEANAVVRSRVIRESDGGVAPLPLIGLEGRFDFTPRWSAEVRVQYLQADVDEIDGSVTEGRVALTWRKNPYLVFGIGYRTFGLKVDSRNEDTPGLVDMQIPGPMLFFRASL
jgi:hypothetical protein